MKDRYTFEEFIAAKEGEDFNVIEPANLEWAKKICKEMGNVGSLVHEGDCTSLPITCLLCTYEEWLNDYRRYYLNKMNHE